ncbi:MAG: response regulator [Lachnospiraceae bacterium]|nr:response regulator [Lachnospiraceae bacterium]
MKKRFGLLSKFAVIFVVFSLITVIVASFATYIAQYRFYRQSCWNEIHRVGTYLKNLVLEDQDDFIAYTEFYKEHFKEMRIPYDFDEYRTAQNEFIRAYNTLYPDKSLYTDIKIEDLPEDLQLLYYTYRHEYWLLTFEHASESFNLPYTYFLTCKEDIYHVVYQIDAERTEDPEHPGYLYLGDEYYNDPAVRDLLWKTWETGIEYEEAYEWDNAWGHTYSHYTPLIVNGQKIGLVVAEINVDDVNEQILLSSFRLGISIAAIFTVGILVLLWILNREFISKITFLSGKIVNFSKDGDPETVRDIKSYPFKNDEIGILAAETANMISEIETHENELERAAQMKTDFLANMSHEIRTPMNSVIGMAEMALREKIPDTARNYISQIKSSGRILLTVINDILDFSKIESGKMEIVTAEYVPMSMFNDVSNIIMMRLGSKDVDLNLDISPELPAILYGDNIRIRQILINLANNAVKFTESGHIAIKVDYDKTDDSSIMLIISVEDTGIGIKKEDLTKIFESFSQVDSKRNRAVEGTGLGLAISERLTTLMNGKLDVTSEYGKGSTFTISIPQRVIEWTPGVELHRPNECIGISLLSSKNLNTGFKRDSCKLGVISYQFDENADLMPRFEEIMSKYPGCDYFLFTEESMLTPDRMVYLESNPEIVVVIVSGFGEYSELNLSNQVHINKPLSVMNISMIYNREKVFFNNAQGEEGDFTAPEAKVLIVDDNAVNLAVAEGLIEPLGMSVMTADNGRDAIKLCEKETFDIIFMDHMMPEMDGIEATHLIRERYPRYKNIPIIALTANAIGNAKERFLSEGLDDFIPKPIDVKNMIAKVRKWLPDEKIKPADPKIASESKPIRSPEKIVDNPMIISDLDTGEAIAKIGSEKVFFNVLKEYYRVIPSKYDSIKDSYENADWGKYTIEVHALKSSSAQIGAMSLSAMAARLEKAGKETDIEYIKDNTEAMLEKYLSYKDALAPFAGEQSTASSDSRPAMTEDILSGLFESIKTAADELDLDKLEAAAETLDKYSFPDDKTDLVNRLKDALNSIDPDACLDVINNWETT